MTLNRISINFTAALIGLSIVSQAYAGSYNSCSCGYDGITGDFALTIATHDFANATLRTQRVGTFFGEEACLEAALTSRVCALRSEDSYRYCNCQDDAISGNYLLTSFLFDAADQLIVETSLAYFNTDFQCTSAALNLLVCN